MGWGQGMAGIPAEAPWGPADTTFDPIFGVNWQKHYSDAEDQRSAMKTIKITNTLQMGLSARPWSTTAATSEALVNDRHLSPAG